MFLILALPRSRTAWMAHYLNYPLARPLQPVGHEILTECRTVDDFFDNYRRGMWGTVETGAASLWRIVRREMPECRIILVRRPLIECYHSLARQGVMPDMSLLAELNHYLDLAAADPAIISLPYELLSDPAIGRWLFEYCLELEWDVEWWQKMVATKIQVDMPYWVERMEEKREQMVEFFLDANRLDPEAISDLVYH